MKANSLPNIVIKMRGLPYSTTETEISDFFSGLHIAPGGVSIGRDASGRASGEAHVEFVTDQDAQSAMLLNRQRIGSRYIELFRTKQAPNVSRRGMAAGSAEGGGGTSDSLRLRGMPFNSTEADVQSFFKGCASRARRASSRAQRTSSRAQRTSRVQSAARKQSAARMPRLPAHPSHQLPMRASRARCTACS